MLTRLPYAFGGHDIARQWIPKGVPMRGTTRIPRDGLAPRSGKLVSKVEKVVIGDTGYRGLTAQAAADDLAQAYGHLIVDNEHIVECVPTLTSGVGLVEQAHFVRTIPGQEFDAEQVAIAVNLCFGGGIEAEKTYTHCIGLLAYICHRFGLEASALRPARDLDRARVDPDTPLKAAGKDFDALSESVAELLRKAQETTQAKRGQ